MENTDLNEKNAAAEEQVNTSAAENPAATTAAIADSGKQTEPKNKKKEFLMAVKYTAFAASAGVIQIGLFTLLNEVFHWSYWVSYLIALVCSVIWNFTFNRKFTFHSAANIPVAMLKVAAYYVVFTPLSTLLENYLTETVGWNEYVVTVINMIINFVTEFLYQRLFVFGKTIDTNVAGGEGSNNV